VKIYLEKLQYQFINKLFGL